MHRSPVVFALWLTIVSVAGAWSLAGCDPEPGARESWTEVPPPPGVRARCWVWAQRPALGGADAVYGGPFCVVDR